MTQIAVALKDGVVQQQLVTPDFASDQEYAEWVVPMLVGPFQGHEIQMLRPEEVGIAVQGATKTATGWAPAVTPLEQRIEQIDEQTAAKIQNGYLHNGVVLSTSLAAQVRWLGALRLAEMGSLPFPFQCNSIDDAQVYTVPDIDDLRAIVAGIGAQTLAIVGQDVAAKMATRAIG